MKKSKFSCGGDFDGFNGGEPTKKKFFFVIYFHTFFCLVIWPHLISNFIQRNARKKEKKNYNDTCVCVCVCDANDFVFLWSVLIAIFFGPISKKMGIFDPEKLFCLSLSHTHTHRMAINEKWPSSSVVDETKCVCVQTKQSKKNQN